MDIDDLNEFPEAACIFEDDDPNYLAPLSQKLRMIL